MNTDTPLNASKRAKELIKEIARRTKDIRNGSYKNSSSNSKEINREESNE